MEYISAKRAAQIKGVTPAAIYAAFESGALGHVIVADKKVTTEELLQAYSPLPSNGGRKGVKLGPRRTRETL